MKVDLYERVWLVMAVGMIAAFLGAVVIAAGTHALHPPSHMETIDPAKVLSDSEFATGLGVTTVEGAITVRMVVKTYVFEPSVVRVPAGAPVTFRMTSPDVIHGFQIVDTNANAMVIPGYVTQFTTTFHRPGDYLVLCNEFCGLSHHLMQGRLIVEEPS